MFRPCRERVCNFKIQKFSPCSNRLRIFSFLNDLLWTSSMIVNIAWTLKLWPGIWKCLSHGGSSVLQTSFLCVFILKFKLHSDFPTYCDFSQRVHSIRQITQLLLQETLCLIKRGFFLKTLWKAEQGFSFLQQKLIDLVKHGWHFPLLNFFTFKICLLSKTLLPRLCL